MKAHYREQLPPHLAKLKPEQLRDFAIKNAANRERVTKLVANKEKGYSHLLRMLGGTK